MRDLSGLHQAHARGSQECAKILAVRRLYAGMAKGMLSSMEIDPNLADQALRAALEKYPQFASFGPRLIAHALLQGSAFMLEYEKQPPPELGGAWDFQNAAVKGYKRLADL